MLGGRENGSRLAAKEVAPRFSIREVVMAIDPVCGMNVDEKNAEFQTQVGGKKYFFCSEECKKEFLEKPEEYVETAA
jgi:YHS domain-containing protein